MLEKTRQRKVSKDYVAWIHHRSEFVICATSSKQVSPTHKHVTTAYDSEVKNNWPIMNDESNFGLSTCLAALRVGPTLTKGFRRFGAVLNHELT